jgi:hypothetical protein
MKVYAHCSKCNCSQTQHVLEDTFRYWTFKTGSGVRLIRTQCHICETENLIFPEKLYGRAD